MRNKILAFLSSVIISIRRLLVKQSLGFRTKRAGNARRFKIGIFKHDRIGDFVLASGAIRAIVSSFALSECVLIVSPIAFEIASELFPDVKIISLSGPRRFGRLHGSLTFVLIWWIFIGTKCLKNVQVDYLICLRHHPDPFYDCALFSIPAHQSYGIRPSNGPRGSRMGQVLYQFTCSATYPQLENVLPPLELEAHRRVISLALKRVVSLEELTPSLESTLPSEEFLLVSPYGTSAIRDYPTESLTHTLRVLRKSTALPIVIAAPPSGEGRVCTLAHHLTNAGVSGVSVCFPASTHEFLNLLKIARAVLTVETATAHLACALDKPTVVIIGGGHFGEFGPWFRSEMQIWLTNSLPCFGCDWKCIYLEPRCITKIASGAVVQALLERCPQF